ncbi:MAG: PucR family transcriptional regulator, partial [Mycobacterium sp.]|nr:PucR family transcriptional regulator [Mycobacterium sp.]
MGSPLLDSDVEVAHYVAETAAGMHDRLGEVSSVIRCSLEDEIPELRGDAGLSDLLGASVEGNVDTLLQALRYDIAVQRVEAPTAALEYARRLAQHGVPVNALVRAYRLGQRRMNEQLFAAVRSLDVASTTRYAVIEAITATLSEYIDWVSQQVVVVYEDERERWLENQNTMRAVRVREVLAGKKTHDLDAATNAIRYPLRWHHLGLVMWYPDVDADGDEIVRLQRFLRELSHAAQAGASPLFVPADRLCGWGWLPYRAATSEAVAAVRRFAANRPDAPNLAIGTLAAGVEGFRRSHREAESTRAVAIARSDPEPTVLAASDPGLSAAALMGADIGGAREWVAAVLGELGADSDNDERLRETLRVFLGCG